MNAVNCSFGTTNQGNFYAQKMNKRAGTDLPQPDENITKPGLTPEDVHREKEQIEGAAKGFDILIKCMRIAFRIMNGDNVPAKDNQILQENYPEMHEKAWAMRKVKENPKEYDSEFEDEDESCEICEAMNAETELNIQIEGLDIRV